MTRSLLQGALVGILTGLFCGPAQAQGRSLAEHFGFGGVEIIKIDRGAGPVAAADMNGDGRVDLIVVNNFKSRIEVYYQRNGAGSGGAGAPLRANELAENENYRREFISVSHRVGAIVAHDFDADGLNDLIYAGQPVGEIVFLRQQEPGVFEADRKHRVKGLMSNKDSLAVADVVGDEAMELLTLAEGEIRIWTIDGRTLVHRQDLAAGAPIFAFWIEDLDGNGRADVIGAMPEDSAPVRVWLATVEDGEGVLAAQLRFELPPLRELEVVRLPGEKAARLAIIERASKRIAIYQLETEPVEESGNRDAAMSVFSFTDAGNRKRDVTVVDADGDGLLDLLATDTEASAVVLYRQVPGRGLMRTENAPSYADIDFIAAGNVDDDDDAELFVLSEKEGVVGRSDLSAGTIPYPLALQISDGWTPVVLNLVQLDTGPVVAAVIKEGRKYAIELIGMDGTSTNVDLGSASRAPDSIVGLDADQDGRTDLLLFTRDKPMTMLHAQESGFKALESKDMGQFGLVRAASSQNTAVFDIDHDGKPELLIANRNFIRAVRYDPDPPAGVSPGWQVVRQLNADDPDSQLVAITVLGDRIVAADKEKDRLVFFAEDDSVSAGWRETDSLAVQGFSLEEIYAGAFAGDGNDGILAVGGDGFAVIQMAGERVALREVASWRTDDEHRLQHELTAGDVNGDGFVDLVSLDAGEQMLEIFTFSEAGRFIYGMGFQVFESKIFSGGEPREFEPSMSLIADVTGDGADDIILLAHDRILIYPQMTEPAEMN